MCEGTSFNLLFFWIGLAAVPLSLVILSIALTHFKRNSRLNQNMITAGILLSAFLALSYSFISNTFC
ncbi:MAG: hypothetical protein ABIJ34_04650 [archaeon]